jgi:hypothetical protein
MSSDVAASKTFYGRLFGWGFEDQPTGDDNAYTLCTKGGKSVAGMMKAGEGMPVCWTSYVTVSDVDATAEKIPKAGGQVMQPPFDVMDAGRMAVIMDPTGAVLCIWKPNQHIGAQLVNENGTFTWSELMTPDIDKAAAFYREIFGWTAVPFEGMNYTVFNNAAGRGVAGAMNPPMEGMPTYWGIYFSVDDCDGTVADAQKAGATVLMPPTDMEGVGRMAALQDPQGAVFSVIKNAGPTG